MLSPRHPLRLGIEKDHSLSNSPSHIATSLFPFGMLHLTSYTIHFYSKARAIQSCYDKPITFSLASLPKRLKSKKAYSFVLRSTTQGLVIVINRSVDTPYPSLCSPTS